MNSEGPLWRENRAFICRQTFGAKNSGNPLKEMQNCVQKETVEMLQLLRRECEERGSVDPDIFLSSAFSNVVCSMGMCRQNLELTYMVTHLVGYNLRLT